MSEVQEDPFEIVDSPWGHIERWRASTLATGTMGALAQVYDVVKNDSAAVAARGDELKAHEQLVRDLCAQVDEFQRRFDAHVARQEAAEARRQADAEEQRRFEEEPIEEPPGTDDTHVPGGELHDLPAKEEEELLEPPEEPEPAEDAAGVPLSYGNVPTSYVRGQPDIAGDLPEELTEAPEPAPEPEGSVYPQPTAVQLNEV